MASVNNEAANTQKMRDHHARKQLQQKSTTTHTEIDLAATPGAISLDNSVALNIRSGPSLGTILAPIQVPSQFLISDVDHQIIFKIVLKDLYTLTQVSFHADGVPAGDLEELDMAPPRRVKCFPNIPDLDFSECDVVEACQTIDLTEDQVKKGVKIPLRGSRFQRCSSVQFFVEENMDDRPFTFINHISLWGFISPSYLAE